MTWISPEIVDQVVQFGISRAPHEACGLITPDSMVVELPNSSLEPYKAYDIKVDDLVNALNQYIARSHNCQFGPDDVVVWHTHPAGSIGPSKGDMREKMRGFRYLVVSIPGGQAVQF
jgi:proteasome lid subunit RPN8/RPN11